MKGLLNPVLPPLAPAAFSLAAGILAGRAGPALPAAMATGLILLLLASVLACPLNRISFLCCLAAAAWGVLSMSAIVSPDHPRHHISTFADGRLYDITGRVDSFTRQFPGKRQVVFRCDTLVLTNGDRVRTSGKILLNIYRSGPAEFQSPGFGARLAFTARLRPIRNFSNPGGFDYRFFLQCRGIHGSAHVGMRKLRVLDHPDPEPGELVLRKTEGLRDRFGQFLARHAREGLPGPPDPAATRQDAAQVINAMVTGKKHALSKGLRDDFARSGASHILAISGLHMSILAFGVYRILYFLLSRSQRLTISGAARKLAGVMTLGPLLGYAVFTGGSPSAQRAFIMTAAFMAAILSEKENDPLNTLCLAALVILGVDPPALFSISFQLSFAALTFILLGFKAAGRRGLPAPRGRWTGMLITSTLVTVLASLGTFPLIARYFNLVSYAQVAANLVLIPVMGFVCLPLGFLVLLTMDAFPGAAAGILDLCLAVTEICIDLIQTLSGWPQLWSRVVTPAWIEVALIYLFLSGLLCLAFKQKKAAAICLAVSLTAGAVSAWSGIKARFYPGQTAVTVLDVGQGSAAVIRTAGGKVILMDGGGFPGISGFDVGRYIVGPFLWRCRIKTIDAVILSHPESDHMNGLVFIMENFRVNTLVRNRDTSESDSFSDLIRAAKSGRTTVIVPETLPLTMKWAQTRLEVFPAVRPLPGRNENSLVSRITYQEFSMLFPGDIEINREQMLAERLGKKLKSLVMLAPHHGSRTSSSNIFLDQAAPESVIVSCGYMNRYGLPHGPVLDRYRARGIRIFRTDLHGALILTTDGNTYQITSHRDG